MARARDKPLVFLGPAHKDLFFPFGIQGHSMTMIMRSFMLIDKNKLLTSDALGAEGLP